MRRKKHGLIFSVVLLLIAALCLPSCANDSQATWDEMFVQELNPDADIIKKLNGSIQNVDLKSSIDGVTVHVKQTLGDEKTLYIAMDVVFPDDVDLKTMMAPPGGDSIQAQIIPKDMAILEGKATNADIKGLSWEEIHDKYKYNWLFFEMDTLSSLNIRKTSCDFANNTISYLLLFNSDIKRLNVNTVSLFVGDFVLNSNGTDIPMTPGIHTIAWTPQNESAVRELEITAADGSSRGNIVLSPFSFNAYVTYSQFKTADEFDQSIRFINIDGSEMKRPIYLVGSASPDSGMTIIDTLFSSPRDIDNLREIQIGGYTVKVQLRIND